MLRESAALVVDSKERMQRVEKYLEELQVLDLTKVEEEQQMVKRRSLQISLELQDMKDNLMQLSSNSQMNNEGESEGQQCSDPSVTYFGMEWKAIFKTCRWISKELNTLLEHLLEENVVGSYSLEKLLVEIGGLENDVMNHKMAVFRDISVYETISSNALKEHQLERSHSCKDRGQRERVKPKCTKSGSLRGLFKKKRKIDVKEEENDDIPFSNIAKQNYLALKRKSLSLDEGINMKCSFLQSVSCF